MLVIRIYALAKELQIDSKELVAICTKAGIRGKASAMASLTAEEVVCLRAFIRDGKAAEEGKGSSRPPRRPRRRLSNGYFASKKGEVFHWHDCESVNAISETNLIEYATWDEAIAGGKNPHAACQPRLTLAAVLRLNPTEIAELGQERVCSQLTVYDDDALTRISQHAVANVLRDSALHILEVRELSRAKEREDALRRQAKEREDALRRQEYSAMTPNTLFEAMTEGRVDVSIAEGVLIAKLEMEYASLNKDELRAIGYSNTLPLHARAARAVLNHRYESPSGGIGVEWWGEQAVGGDWWREHGG